MTSNFQKIKGLIFTHNCRSQKNQNNWSNNLAPKALVFLPIFHIFNISRFSANFSYMHHNVENTDVLWKDQLSP
jgi:hypothetical protein